MRCLPSGFVGVLIAVSLQFTAICAIAKSDEAATNARVESLWKDATAAQQAQDYSKAATLYRQILRLQPDLTEAEVNLGLMYQLTGDLNAAVACFRHVLARSPQLYTPNLMAGLDYLKMDSPKSALPYLERATAAKPDDKKARVGLANAYLELHQYTDAKDNFRHAIEIDGHDADAWYGLAATYLSLEKESESRIARISPALASALLGESYLQQGRAAKAARILRSVAETSAAAPCIHSLLGFALLRDAKLEDAATQFRLDWNGQNGGCLLAKLGTIVLAANRGDAESALKELREASAVDAEFVSSNAEYFWPDLVKAGLERSAQGIMANRESAGASTPSEPARVYLARGRYSACSSALAGAPAALPSQDLPILARCTYYIGRDDVVFTAADLFLKAHPNDPEALYWRIQATGRLGVAALTKATDLDPDSASLHTMSGDMLRGKGDFAAAAAEYQKAVALKPTFLAAHLGLAKSFYADDDREGAEREARTVLGTHPKDPEANYLMGEVLVSRKQFAEALPFLERALHASPDELPHVHADISKVYAEKGDVPHAISELKLALPADSDGSYHYRLGRLYLQAGNRAASAEAMQESARLRRENDSSVSLENEQ